MGLKFLEAFVSHLLGEPIEFLEAEPREGSGSGIDSQFSFHGQDVYSKPPAPEALAPQFHGLGAYAPAPVSKPQEVPTEFHGLAAYTAQPLTAPAAAKALSVDYSLASLYSEAAPKKAEEAGPALEIHGMDAYSVAHPDEQPTLGDKDRASKVSYKFHGEESYTPSLVPKVISTPAPAVDVLQAEEQASAIDAAQEVVLKNPAITGAALVQHMKAMGIVVTDSKAVVGKPDPNAPSVDQQIQNLLLKSPEMSGQSLLAAMKSLGLVVSGISKERQGLEKKKESDSATSQVATLRSEAEVAKYKHIDFTPPAGARAQAKSGLELRSKHGRGGTAVGVARARDLANGKAMSPSTIKRMVSFFARHEVDKQGKGFKPGSEGYPSAGLVAWKLWGGDAGKAWANKVAKQMDAADKRESRRPVSYTVVDSRFLEASRDDGIGPTKFKVALIAEGLGNLRDCYYYTRQCLETAVATAAFEGKKCFADHPSMSEEQDRPERSVRDILGHFENVHIEEGADGSARLIADLIIPHTAPFEWARTLVASAINFAKKYPDRELVGLSINASGDAKSVGIDEFMQSASLPEGAKPKILKAKEVGATQIRVVSEIKDAVSVDLVTEPGARGKILEFIESEPKEIQP